MRKRSLLKTIAAAGATSGFSLTVQASDETDGSSRRYENADVSADNEKALREYAVWLLTQPKTAQEEVVKSLPKRKKEAVIDAFKPMTTENTVESVEIVDATESSQSSISTEAFSLRVTYSATLKNTLNLAVATLYNAVDWSYDGTVITSASTEAWGTAGGLGWNYEGITDSFTSGGSGDESYESYKKGLFRYCPNNYCIDENTAEVYVLVDDEGRHRAEGGPNLRER